MIKVNVAVAFGPNQYNENLNVKIDKFAGGEINPKIEPTNWNFVRPDVTITAHIKDAGLLIALLLTADACRRRWPGCVIRLFIPYLPYARQDRVCNEGEALSLAVVSQMINSIKAETVTIVDAHSEGAMVGIDNCINVSALHYIKKAGVSKGMVMIAPDAGALKKTYQYAAALESPEVIVASKHRDTATGNISHTEIYGDVEGLDVLICDDICDGGRTFIELAKKLDEKGVKSKTLFVTHGIFSHGYDTVADAFSKVITTNSFHPGAHGTVCPDGQRRDKFLWVQV